MCSRGRGGGAVGVFCKFLSGDVPLGLSDTYSIPDHAQLHCATLFLPRHQKLQPCPTLAECQSLVFR